MWEKNIGLHVQYPILLWDINGTWILWKQFRTMFRYQISWKSVRWEPSCSMRTDGRTDMTKLTVAFRNFAKRAWTERAYFASALRHTTRGLVTMKGIFSTVFNPLNPELNPICYLLALLAHHFLHVSRIGVKSLTLRLLMSYIYGAHILDVSRSHTTTHHSR